MKVLIVEDDIKILNFLELGLKETGFATESSTDGKSGLERINANKYDMIILDVMLPEIDGLSILKNIRNQKNLTPVLLLSAKVSLEDRVQGLELGADDYLVKPFALAELTARMNALLRRTHQPPSTNLLTYEDLQIDLEKREVKRSGQKFSLQLREFSLLVYFMQNPGKVLTKSLILEKVWGYDFDPQTNVVDVLVCRLRNKIDKDFTEKLIQTHRGVGYVLKKD